MLSTDPWLDSLHGASILSLFKALARLKYQVKVLLPSISEKIIEDEFLSVTGLKVKRYIPLFTLISLYCRYLRSMLIEKPTVLIFDFPMLPIFLLTKILWKSKGVMLILSRPVGEGGFKGWLRFLHFRLSLIIGKIFVNAFTAISPFEAFEFSMLGNIPKSKITVIPSPLGEEFEKFSLSMDVNELRSRMELGALLSKKVLLYHGVLDEQRGILQLLKFFAESFKEDDEIVLLLVGDGPAKNSIKNFIQQNKAGNIILLPPVPYSKMPEVIAGCDIGLVLLPDHPWWRYQCPTKLIEFLALGKSVIVSDLPGIKWIAGNSPLVTRLNRWDQNSFKEELIRMMSNLKKIEIYATDAHQKMIKRFSSRAIALKLRQLIDSLEAPQNK